MLNLASPLAGTAVPGNRWLPCKFRLLSPANPARSCLCEGAWCVSIPLQFHSWRCSGLRSLQPGAPPMSRTSRCIIGDFSSKAQGSCRLAQCPQVSVCFSVSCGPRRVRDDTNFQNHAFSLGLRPEPESPSWEGRIRAAFHFGHRRF